MTSFPLITLPADNFFPGSYVAVNLGAGGNIEGSTPVNVLLMGNALSTSPCVANGLYDGYIFSASATSAAFVVASLADAANQFGVRSELYLGYAEFVKTNPNVPVDLIAVKESTGSSATATTTITGTATAGGAIQVSVGDVQFTVGVSNGDTATVIGANIVSAANSQYLMPATVTNSSGTLTFTAVHKGTRGNDIRFAVQVTGTTSFGVTSSSQNFAYFTGGSGSDSYTNALATINNFKYRYIVTSAENTSGNLQALAAQVTTNALPIPGLRQRVVSAAVGTVGTANAFAKAINNPRVGTVWQENGNKTRMQLAAQFAAGLSLGEAQTIPQINYDFMGTGKNAALFNCSLPFDGSKPSRADLTSALANGVSPVENGTNQGVVVSAITTYTQDSLGNPTSAVRDWCVVSIMDNAADRIQAMWSQQEFDVIAPDPPAGQSLPNGNVATPKRVTTLINYVLTQMASSGLVPLGELAKMQSLTNVVVDGTNPTRMDAIVNVVPSLPCHQLAVNLNQLTSVL